MYYTVFLNQLLSKQDLALKVRDYILKSLIIRFLTLLSIITLSGCASVSEMPLKSGLTDIDTSQKSLIVGKLSIKNENAPSHQPYLLCIFVEKDGQLYSYKSPTLVSDMGTDGKSYFFSMDVPPGKATIKFARFLRDIPLLVLATADLPFEHEIDIPKDEVIYIGNIQATIKPRENDEQPRAGSVIPLIDQAVAGFSSGTFEVEIIDDFQIDTTNLINKYPALSNRNITKQILPSWFHPESIQVSNETVASVE